MYIKTCLLFISLCISTSVWAGSFGKVLFVGDSHSYGNFGTEVDKYLRANSSSVTTYASCGSSPSTWLNKNGKYNATNCGHLSKDPQGREKRQNSHGTEYFPDEIQNIHPDLTVIAMGTNILASPATIKREVESIKKMLAEVHKVQSKCIWVGPPSITKRPFVDNLDLGIKEIKSVIEKNGCVFVDSKPLTTYPAKGDGIHYGAQSAAKWGKDVVNVMKQKQDLLVGGSSAAPKASTAEKGEAVR